jgi:hypothetical protein
MAAVVEDCDASCVSLATHSGFFRRLQNGDLGTRHPDFFGHDHRRRLCYAFLGAVKLTVHMHWHPARLTNECVHDQKLKRHELILSLALEHVLSPGPFPILLAKSQGFRGPASYRFRKLCDFYPPLPLVLAAPESPQVRAAPALAGPSEPLVSPRGPDETPSWWAETCSSPTRWPAVFAVDSADVMPDWCEFSSPTRRPTKKSKKTAQSLA